MTLKLKGGYASRKFKYKGMVFHLTRADEGAGWYCNFAHTIKGRHPVETKYWTGGDTHYFRLNFVMKGIREEIDSGDFTVDKDRTFRKASNPVEEVQ